MLWLDDDPELYCDLTHLSEGVSKSSNKTQGHNLIKARSICDILRKMPRVSLLPFVFIKVILASLHAFGQTNLSYENENVVSEIYAMSPGQSLQKDMILSIVLTFTLPSVCKGQCTSSH